MSIVQALIGSIVSSTSGGGGGGGSTYPSPGSGTYQTTGASGLLLQGTAYDPGGAVVSVASASAGWRRVISTGYWCNLNSQNNDNPAVFQNVLSETADAFGGFGQTEGADAFAMEWTGYFRAQGNYSYWNFYTDSDDVAMFWIGNAAYNPTAENAYVTSNNGTTYPTNSLLLTDGMWYPIRMRFQEWSGGERCQVFASADGATASSMLAYFNSGHVLYNGATGSYGSNSSSLLNLGDATNNIYSGSGNWLDSSPALNHAVPVGNVLPTFLSGEAGGVWQLDGSQYFNIPTMVNYKEQTMTMSIWFNCASDNTFSQNLLSCELSYKLRLNPGGIINIMVGDGVSSWTVNNSTSAGAFTYGTWNHIMVTVDVNGTILYLNGQAIGNYGGTTIGTAGQFPVNIGSHSNGSDLFTGKIGEVRILSSVFNSGDVATEYTTTAPRYAPAATPDITGTITIGNNGGSLYGFAPDFPQQFITGHGSSTQTPTGIIRAINYYPDYQETVVNLTTGTYTGANGELVVSDGETINGITTYTVKIGSITQTMTATPEPDTRIIIYGNDPFNIVAQNGQTVAFEITLA